MTQQTERTATNDKCCICGKDGDPQTRVEPPNGHWWRNDCGLVCPSCFEAIQREYSTGERWNAPCDRRIITNLIVCGGFDWDDSGYTDTSA